MMMVADFERDEKRKASWPDSDPWESRSDLGSFKFCD